MNAKQRLQEALDRHGFKPAASGEFMRTPLIVLVEPSGHPGMASCSDGETVRVCKLEEAAAWVDAQSGKLDDFEQGF